MPGQTGKRSRLNSPGADFRMISSELVEYHRLSLEIMSERGILPPLYGGSHLESRREIVPLWSVSPLPGIGQPTLSLLMLRSIPEVEPCMNLRVIRKELEIVNDWSASELLTMLIEGKGIQVNGSEKLEGMMIFLVIGGDQIQPAPGYDNLAMLNYLSATHPYAVFPIIPLAQYVEALPERWNALTQIRAEVVYADSPRLLEAAVWDYRLRMAIEAANTVIDSGTGIPIRSIYDLVGRYETEVVSAVRLYGSTSPVRAQQEKLDFLREENGDLIVSLPLKTEVEPVPVLAQQRAQVFGKKRDIAMQLSTDAPEMARIWPEIRAHRYFCARVRRKHLIRKNGKYHVQRSSKQPVLDWFWADDLTELHRLVHLNALHEMITLIDVAGCDSETPT